MRQFVRLGSAIAIGVALSSSLTACGMNIFGNKPAIEAVSLTEQRGQTLWKSGQQYVKIVNSDANAALNDHPATLTAEQLKTVIASLYITERFVLKSYENPVFSAGEQQVLSTHLANALRQVQAEQDVNFATVGVHPSAFGKEHKSTSGRLFVRDGRLNIIFGLLHETYSETDTQTGHEADSQQTMLLAGSRRNHSDLETVVSLGKGQSFYLDPKTGKQRTDWVVIDISTVLLSAKQNTIQSVSPELLQDVAESKQETGNIREDISNMKEVIFELTGEIERLKQEVERLKSRR